MRPAAALAWLLAVALLLQVPGSGLVVTLANALAEDGAAAGVEDATADAGTAQDEATQDATATAGADVADEGTDGAADESSQEAGATAEDGDAAALQEEDAAAQDEDGAEASDDALQASSEDLAASVESSAKSAGVLSTKASGTDLAAAWEASGTSSEYTISSGGTYYLGEDLTVSSRLVVSAEGQDVTIEFYGHTLASSSSSGVVVQADAAASLTLEGGEDGAAIELCGSKATNAVKSAADELVIRDLAISSRTSDDTVDLSDLDATAVRATAGSVAIEGCELSVDLGNQGNAAVTSGNSSLKNGPAALRLASGVESASVSSTILSTVNSKMVYDYSSTLYSTGYAHGLYSAAEGTVSLDGCTVSVASALGTAKGVEGANVKVQGDGVSITLEASSYAIGISSLASSGVTLSGPVAVATQDCSPTYEAALYSTEENAFTLGSGFAASGQLGVWVGESADAANDDGACFATFASGVGSSARQTALASLANALGDEGACELQLSGSTVVFALDESRAPAQVVSASGATTYYASVSAAVAAMQAGQTLRLLADVGEISFDVGSEGEAYAIDLAGFSATGLVFASAADLSVSSDGTGGISGASSKGNAAVYGSGSGALALSDLSISCSSATVEAYGIYLTSTGALSLQDVDVSARSSATRAQAVRSSSASGGAISIQGGSLSAKALAYGVVAEGLGAATKSAAVRIEDCPIEVQGVSSQTRGIEFACTLELVGSTGATSVAVSTATEVSGTTGVLATASGTSATFTDCSISVRGSEDESTPYWCVGTGGSSYDAAFTFSGSVLLESSTGTALQHYSTPLAFAADAQLQQDELVVSSLDGTNATFAQLDEELDVLEWLAAVQTYESGSFAGCTAQAGLAEDGVVALSWAGTGSVVNLSTGTSYHDLGEAVAEAAAGDELRLQSDLRANASVEVATTLTLDVCGFTLTSAAAGDAGGSAASAAGIAVTGGATLTLADSAGGGQVDVLVGKANDASATTYRGISVLDGGALVLDGLQLGVSYTGGSLSANPKLSLYGICLDDGSLSMQDGSALSVASAPQADAFGASEVAGVYASSSAGSVSIAAGCGIGVENDSAVVQTGSSDYPDDSSAGNGTSSSNVQMLELDLEEGSELYEMVQEKFIEQAECDSATDSQGKEHSANLYYATNMQLENGMKVWAYSEQLADSDIGTLDNIVATHVFVRAPYNRENNAYGLYAESGYAASATVSGQVSVTTGLGNAYGIYATSYDTVGYGSASLAATCSEELYLKRTSTSFDLKDYISITGFDSTKLYYPSNASMQTVRVSNGLAQAVYDASEQAEERAIGQDELDELLYPATTSTVTVSFENLRDADGGMLEGESFEVPYGSTLAEAGCEQVQPADYTEDDVTYRFVGWKLSSYIYEADAVYASTPMGGDVSGATDGAVSYSAVYVPVEEGQHLATFRVEDTLTAYPVDDGEAASYLTCNSSAGQAVPSKVTSEDGYSFTFAGWAEGSSDVCLVQDDEQLEHALAAADEDVAYTARFNQVVNTVNVYLYTQSISSGSLVTKANITSGVDWTAAITELAASVASVGDYVNYEGVIYSFVGWAPRQSDAEALYTSGELWAGGFAMGYPDNNATFFGVYEQSDQLVDVSFYADGVLLGSAEGVKASATIAQALSAAGIDTSSIEVPDEQTRFRGWNTSADAEDILLASVNTLYDVCGEATELVLHAIWGAKQYTVTFLNTDGSTLASVTVDYGTTVEESNPNFDLGLSGTAARLFEGWRYADGTAFSTSETIITEDTTVYAVFGTDTSSSTSLALASSSTSSLSSSGSLSAGSLTGNSLSLSGGLSSSSLALSSDALEEGAEALAASAGQAGAGLQQADEALADDDDASGGDGTLASRVALACMVLMLLFVVAFVARWFALRRKHEDDEVAAAAGQAALERVRF